MTESTTPASPHLMNKSIPPLLRPKSPKSRQSSLRRQSLENSSPTSSARAAAPLPANSSSGSLLSRKDTAVASNDDFGGDLPSPSGPRRSATSNPAPCDSPASPTTSLPPPAVPTADTRDVEAQTLALPCEECPRLMHQNQRLAKDLALQKRRTSIEMTPGDYETRLNAKDAEIAKMRVELMKERSSKKDALVAQQIALERRIDVEDALAKEKAKHKAQAQACAQATKDLVALQDEHRETVKTLEDTLETVQTTHRHLQQYDRVYDEVVKLLAQLHAVNGSLPEHFEIEDVKKLVGVFDTYRRSYDEHKPQIPSDKLKDLALKARRIGGGVDEPPAVLMNYDRFAVCPVSPNTSLGELSSATSLLSPSNAYSRSRTYTRTTSKRSQSASSTATTGTMRLENSSTWAPVRRPKSPQTRRYTICKNSSPRSLGRSLTSREKVVEALEGAIAASPSTPKASTPKSSSGRSRTPHTAGSTHVPFVLENVSPVQPPRRMHASPCPRLIA